MSFRSAVLALAILVPATLVAEAHAQTSCDPEIFDRVCSGDDLTYCRGDTLVTETFSCQEFFTDGVDPNLTCAAQGCSGSGCAELDLETCVGERNGQCIGVGPLYTSDTADDEYIALLTCTGTDVCRTQIIDSALVETCVANPGVGSCTSGDVGRCEGNVAVLCVSNTDFVLTTPLIMDCTPIGAVCEVQSNGVAICAEDCGAGGYGRCDGNSAIDCNVSPPEATTCGSGEVCVDDGDSVRCLDEQCGAGAGRCNGATAVVCSNGTVVDEIDCLTSGQTCTQSDPEFTPGCVTFDERCGPIGQGVCLNAFEAVICEGGQVVSETNCGDLERVCDQLPAGGVGCVERASGEGEGEGDSDDDDDDDDEPPPSLFNCDVTTGGGSLVVFLFALRRRRR